MSNIQPEEAQVARRPGTILLVAGAVVLAALLWFGGPFLRTFRPLPQPAKPSGHVLDWSSAGWAHLGVNGERCHLTNNLWNANPANPVEQEIFTEDLDGTQAFGWRWRAPWQTAAHTAPQIVAYPELICGHKPWDPPMGALPGFPLHPGAAAITADFKIHLKATGTYNMAFSLWVVSSLPARPETIRNEIMIWNANGGQRPSGERRGTMTVQGIDYEVWINPNQTDASGTNPNTWTYIAFVAQQPVLEGPLRISSFVDYLVQQRIVAPDHYLTGIELGNEVAEGSGMAEIQNFAIRVQ